MSKSLFALALPILMTGAAYATPVCNVTQYGAKADGATKNTAAIQKAIDDCSAKKGTVVLSGGTFVSGPLVLKSNITFRVEKGTTLLGSADHDDYPKMEVLRAAGRQSLISSDHAENGGSLLLRRCHHPQRSHPGSGALAELRRGRSVLDLEYDHRSPLRRCGR
ncbi:glycosyl hydrolase family 28-related protein [Terriglobus sp. YAF25]|uniref:glycosyl hydrolase family 28-related protein n=1 Tax=Terriglobus sp. YAF25 TaxID=3233080 RepID=UPI003F9D9EA8